MESEDGIPIWKIFDIILLFRLKSLTWNDMKVDFFTKMINKYAKTITIWLIIVAKAAPLTPYSKVKIRIGSRIRFKTVPINPIIIGIFVSPSPAKIALKNIEKITNPRPNVRILK